MWSNIGDQAWRMLANPFPNVPKQPLTLSSLEREADLSEAVTSHVSGRSTDIASIIMGAQSAIILAGAPNIGKSALIRYLQSPPNIGWSWRDELTELRDQLRLNDIHFVQVDLRPLEEMKNFKDLYGTFVKQCTAAVQSVYQPGGQPSSDLRALRDLLHSIRYETPQGRCFVMLDNIERLGRFGMWFELDSRAQTPQERGIALLNHCDALRALVDLIDEFTSFGAILALESLARPSMGDQFTHISADLARFATMTLQVVTWDDATQFLAQEPESFGTAWANMFRDLGGNNIFSVEEQRWLREQAGTHPYLLQQFCSHLFRLKQEYASIHRVWPETLEDDKGQITEWINERLSSFLARMWQRLDEAIFKASQETRNTFYSFINSLAGHSTEQEMDLAEWNKLGLELRYILYSEGVVRYDPFQPIHYPGATVRNYLVQKVKEHEAQSTFYTVPSPRELSASDLLTSISSRGLDIIRPGNPGEHLLLSEIEYNLFRTLLQHPQHSTEDELMQGAWGQKVERSTFTQRMHHLRKKLKEQCGGEIIENRYGGNYSLKHSDWFRLT
jgi:hypothetical protein